MPLLAIVTVTATDAGDRISRAASWIIIVALEVKHRFRFGHFAAMAEGGGGIGTVIVEITTRDVVAGV